MSKPPRTIWVAFIVVSISLFPFALGIVSLDVYGRLNYPKWESLGSPPETSTRFIAGSVGSYEAGISKNYKGRKTKIYVETITENVYQCCSKDSSTWEKVAREEIKEVNWADYCLNDKDKNQKHIENEIDSYALYWCGETDFGNIYYALHKDGTVWVWKQYGTWLDGGILFFKSFSAGILLIIVGAIILEVRRRKSQNN